MARKVNWPSSVPAQITGLSDRVRSTTAQSDPQAGVLSITAGRIEPISVLDANSTLAASYLDMPQSVVAFADALGTAFSSNSAATAVTFLARLQAATKRVSQRMARIGPLYQINVRWFSDSIAMSIRFDKTSNLVGLLEDLAYVQAEYALEGIFLRGAVTTGPHHHSEYIDYGPALTEAVNLEHHRAGDTTRIMLSPTLQESLSLFGAARLPIVEDLVDQVYFLDFIRSLDPLAGPILRRRIEASYREAEASSERTLRKLSWLASYYNWRMRPRKLLRCGLDYGFSFRLTGDSR
ncbi:MAG: hypothetical protein QOH06_347 [Acidobacteriota bacterium]|jgi:hypothetical protein|nr:hypothetical protein [Acidobacteriota bacterium]